MCTWQHCTSTQRRSPPIRVLPFIHVKGSDRFSHQAGWSVSTLRPIQLWRMWSPARKIHFVNPGCLRMTRYRWLGFMEAHHQTSCEGTKKVLGACSPVNGLLPTTEQTDQPLDKGFIEPHLPRQKTSTKAAAFVSGCLKGYKNDQCFMAGLELFNHLRAMMNVFSVAQDRDGVVTVVRMNFNPLDVSRTLQNKHYN